MLARMLIRLTCLMSLLTAVQVAANMLMCLLSRKHSPCSPGDASSSEQLSSCPSQEVSLLQGDAEHQPGQPALTARLQASPLPPPFLPGPRQPVQGSPERASDPHHLRPRTRPRLLPAADETESRQELRQELRQEPREEV